jgi:hypothetical protein
MALDFHHQASDAVPGEKSPTITHDSARATFFTSRGARFSVSMTGNGSWSAGDADATRGLSGTKRQDYGGGVTLSESAAGTTFAQAGSYQAARDRINPQADMTTSMVSVTGTRGAGSIFGISAMVSAVRLQGGDSMGTSDSYLAAVQPTFNIPKLALSLQPRASYSRTINSLVAADTRVAQYLILVSWRPAWRSVRGTLQAFGDWTQPPAGQAFGRRYGINLTVGWGTRAGALAATPSPTAFTAQTSAVGVSALLLNGLFQARH